MGFNMASDQARYIAKAPIGVNVKRYTPPHRQNSRTHTKRTHEQFSVYIHDQHRHGYAYLTIDKLGKIYFVITIKDNAKKNWIKVGISKWYLYEMLLYHLTLRPIIPPDIETKTNTELWLDKHRNKNKIKDLDNLNWEQVQKDYGNAMVRVKDVVSVSTGKSKEKADAQLRKLIEYESKITMLKFIDDCKNMECECDALI